MAGWRSDIVVARMKEKDTWIAFSVLSKAPSTSY
jgi:hypothetical protein